MKWQNEGLRFSSLGLALAAVIMLAGCGSDSSSGAVNGGGSSSSVASSSEAATSSKAAWDYLNPSITYGEITDARDGQVYKTVVIGTQTWMAENLNYAVDSSWCYENSADSCAKYGRLYQWAAAMNIDAVYNYATWGGSDADHRGVCPSGWHLPSDAEWTTLETYVSARSGVGEVRQYADSWSEIGALLKSADGWNDGGNGTDAYGFSALPAGYGDYYFYYVGYNASFRSATEVNANKAYDRCLLYADADMHTNNDYYKYGAWSVRCVKN